MSCNKTKRQKSRIYDKKSDILPRLCFGLIYPPKKSGSRGMPRLSLFCRFWMHMMKSFLNKVFACLYKSLGQAFGEACSVKGEKPLSRSAEREIFFRRFLFCSFFFCAFFVKRKSGMDFDFFFCLLAILGLCA